jgi:ribosome biogenesis protein SSF1/2
MSSKLDLSKYNDISEFALKTGGYGTDSEAEDLPESKVVLPGDFQGKPKGTKVAVRLEELGPRMKLELIKIQEGLFKGNVLYHRYIKKTKQEIKGLADASKEKHQKEKDEKVKKEAKETRRHKNPEEIFDQDSKDNRDDKRPLKKKKVTFTEFE